MRGWLRRLAGAGRPPATSDSIAQLTAAVRDLTAAQRKQAVQLKKLRETQVEMDVRWQASLDRWSKLAADTQLRQAREAVRVQEKTSARLQELIRASETLHKGEQKWRVIFSRQIDAMMRSLHLADFGLRPPFDITAGRFRLRSQNEEDGIILGLMKFAGVTSGRFVEVGCGRTGGNAALLAYECGWHGLMIDANESAVETVRRRFGHNAGVVAITATVSPANINELLEQHGFGRDIDLFSLDIDSHDYWVFEALAASPRVLVLEYNAAFGSEKALTIPRDVSLRGGPKWYRGASLAALEKLARRKGYRLVACENAGVNAFFLRNDVAPAVPGLSPSAAFRSALDRREVFEAASDDESLIMDHAFPLAEV